MNLTREQLQQASLETGFAAAVTEKDAYPNLLWAQHSMVPYELASGNQMQEAIRRHPSLLWKALNVREYKGL